MINGSRTPKEERNYWQTPGHIFEIASQLFGQFTVDLAANEDNAVCDLWLGEEADSLTVPWANYLGRYRKGWLNPPFSKITPWMEKAIEESKQGFQTVMLIPTPNGDGRDLLFGEAADIVFFDKRVQYIRPNGEISKQNPRGSCLVNYSRNPVLPHRGPRIHFHHIERKRK